MNEKSRGASPAFSLEFILVVQKIVDISIKIWLLSIFRFSANKLQSNNTPQYNLC